MVPESLMGGACRAIPAKTGDVRAICCTADVHDLNGVCLAHPISPEVVGTNRLEQKDLNGKYWIKDIIAATKKGDTSGWTSYVKKNPVSGRTQDKLSYWELHDGLVFKAGLYIE